MLEGKRRVTAAAESLFNAIPQPRYHPNTFVTISSVSLRIDGVKSERSGENDGTG